jgi:hypothetical protein
MLDKCIGHHGNSYFRLLRRHLKPNKSKLVSETNPAAMQTLLSQLFHKNHRDDVPTNLYFSNINVVDYTSFDGKVSKRPAGPLPYVLRYNQGSFQWQREPVNFVVPGSGDSTVGLTGMSISMVYWMARAVNEGHL